jgi:hypothetical protein
MVHRTVWLIHGGSIIEGTVTAQHFNPDYLKVRIAGEERTVAPYSAHLTPESAIQEARELAAVLEDSANTLEERIAV